jgi:3-methyladenine DNA glycosylase AlkC
MKLETRDSPQVDNIDTKLLFDMEAKYFKEVVSKNLDEKDVYIFKVVSDHLDDTIPKKDFVKKLIADRLEEIENWI